MFGIGVEDKGSGIGIGIGIELSGGIGIEQTELTPGLHTTQYVCT